MADRLYVALDFDNGEDALRMVDRLGETVRCYKVGMELYFKTGPQILHQLQEAGKQIFLDLKIHDIPNTAAGAARSCTSFGVSIINVHAAGGIEMMKQAKQAAIETAAALSIDRPLVIAVTQLTSTDRQMMNEQIGIQGSVEDTVVRYAKLAQEAGLDGVVASGQELAAIRQACGDGFVTVIPGIRPAWAASNDQKRILTPADAIKAGAHRLVVGRPITHADDPQDAAKRILEEMEVSL
ncbi:orotidine-5'-phosphate decarboxylase [Effusibacillus dendaii]|nr:orotidine-5'-phosphate decarboxylase [Effusibacillus dendaii]